MTPRKTALPYGVGLVLSIIFVTVGLYLLLTGVNRIANPALGLGLLVLIVPLFPAVSAILQGESRPTARSTALLYLYELATLVFDLLALVMSVPVISLGVLSVIAAMLLVVAVIGLALWALKYGAHLDIAPGIEKDGHFIILALAAGSATYLLAWYLANRYAARGARSLPGLYADMRQRVRSGIGRALIDREPPHDAQ